MHVCAAWKIIIKIEEECREAKVPRPGFEGILCNQ